VLTVAVWGLLTSVSAPTEDDPDAGSWLHWVAPLHCRDASSIEAAVRERLGREVEPGEIRVVARVEEQGSAGYALTLKTQTADVEDRRELTAHDCRALADATALIVALSIDAVAVAEHVDDETAASTIETVETIETIEPAPAPSPPQPDIVELAPPPPVRAVEPRADASTSPGTPGAVGVSLAGGGILGTLPGISGGPELALSWSRPKWRIELAGSWYAPRTDRSDRGAVRVQLGTATARTCARLGTARLEVPLCGGIELGGSRGDGDGVPGARTALGLWVAPVIGTGIRGRVSPRLAPFARVDVAIPVVHPAFELQGAAPSEELFRASAASARLWLGLEVRLFPPP
jgi:hypothetical protein